jgi:hypothetical protein
MGRILQRQRRAAESAFGHQPADMPMGATAAGAMVGFLIAIDDVVAALGPGWDEAAATIFKYCRHVMAPWITLTNPRPNAELRREVASLRQRSGDER